MSDRGQYEPVGIFWDYENCNSASGLPGQTLAGGIRRVASAYGSVILFKAYLDITEVSGARAAGFRSELQCAGVSLTDCPHNGRKDVADKMMLVDMLAFAVDNPPPATVVLISGDRDFAYAVSILRLRGYGVAVILPSGTVHPTLYAQASVLHEWTRDVLATGGAPPTPGDTASPSPVVERDALLYPSTPVRGAAVRRRSESQVGGRSKFTGSSAGQVPPTPHQQASPAAMGVRHRSGSDVLQRDAQLLSPMVSVTRSFPADGADAAKGGAGGGSDNNGNSIFLKSPLRQSRSRLQPGPSRVVLGGTELLPGSPGASTTKALPTSANAAIDQAPSPMQSGVVETFQAYWHRRAASATDASATGGIRPGHRRSQSSPPDQRIALPSSAPANAGGVLETVSQSAQAGPGRAPMPAVLSPLPEAVLPAVPGEPIAPLEVPLLDFKTSSAVDPGAADTSSFTANAAVARDAADPPDSALFSKLLGTDTLAVSSETVTAAGEAVPVASSASLPSSVRPVWKGLPVFQPPISNNAGALNDTNSAPPLTFGSNVSIQPLPGLSTPSSSPTSMFRPPPAAFVPSVLLPANSSNNNVSQGSTPVCGVPAAETSSTPIIHQPELRVPPERFRVLVEYLECLRVVHGINLPLRGKVAQEIVKRDVHLYRKAGVTSFKAYSTLAVQEGLVVLGGLEGAAWISLHEDWYGKIADFRPEGLGSGLLNS